MGNFLFYQKTNDDDDDDDDNEPIKEIAFYDLRTKKHLVIRGDDINNYDYHNANTTDTGCKRSIMLL